MDFRIRQLQCFLTLAEHLHYGRTARALYMSQPTITFQIKSLEQAFGAVLFERGPRQVSLTPAGVAFHAYATKILGTVAEARQHLSAIGSRTHLRISCGPLGQTTLLPAVLRGLARDCPGLSLEIEEITPAEQMARLPQGTLDALLMVAPMPLKGLRFDCLRKEPLVAILSQRNPLAGQRSISVEDLRRETIIAPRLKDCALRLPFLQDLLAPYGIAPRFLEAPHSRSAQMAYVAAGEGIVIGTRLSARDHPLGVVVRPFKEALPRMPLGLASMCANTSPAMSTFRSLVLQCAAESTRRRMPPVPSPRHAPVAAPVAVQVAAQVAASA